ncbi:MAG: hypothetical protein KF704_12935 [Crocinitomicaceae bacterium]|nr:hypothetical protein [Crocinitomicaceae bacterium]NGF76657.1 hypothetical protein [Fluviicola sp. SGL-29]
MSFFRLLSLLTSLAPVILSLGLILGVYYYPFLQSRYRYFLLYMGICLVTDIASRFAGALMGNNLIFFVVFSLLELLFFSAFYRKFFFGRNRVKHVLLTVGAAVYILSEVYLLFQVTPEEFQMYSKTLSSFVILLMAIDFLFEILKKEQIDPALLKYNSVFIIYFSVSLIFFLPVNFLINVPESFKFYFWCVHLLLTILLYTFILIEIWKNGSKQKQLRRG